MNLGSPVLEATVLPTEPQPLSYIWCARCSGKSDKTLQFTTQDNFLNIIILEL